MPATRTSSTRWASPSLEPAGDFLHAGRRAETRVRRVRLPLVRPHKKLLLRVRRRSQRAGDGGILARAGRFPCRSTGGAYRSWPLDKLTLSGLLEFHIHRLFRRVRRCQSNDRFRLRRLRRSLYWEEAEMRIHRMRFSYRLSLYRSSAPD